MQDLGGGIGSGLGRLARAVVVGFGGKVDAAVNSSVGEHGARFISLSGGDV